MQIMNMKPHEILSLLEEASGTKLYERKKDAAMKTLAKKQTKLDEIDEVGRCNSLIDVLRGGLETNRPQDNAALASAHAVPLHPLRGSVIV